MKRTILLLTLAFLAVSIAEAQTRKEIYKLPRNEAAYENSYALYQVGDEYKFAMVTENQKKETFSFIFNKKKIDTWKNIEGATPTFYYLNIEEEQGYIFSYDIGGEEEWEVYLNIRGEKYGPYERLSSVDDKGNYAYMLAGRWYKRLEGKTYGPYLGGVPDSVTKSGKYIYGFYDDDGEAVINVNGSMKGYFDDAYSPKINDNGDFIFGYRDNEEQKWHININDTEWGGYEDVNDPSLNENGDYAFQYTQTAELTEFTDTALYLPTDPTVSADLIIQAAKAYNEESEYDEGETRILSIDYIVFNGKISEPYDGAGLVRLTEGGKLAYGFIKDELFHIVFDGKILGSYNGGIDALNINDNGNYAFKFVQDDQHFVNIDGKEYGPFLISWDIVLSDNGNFIFDGRDLYDTYFININGNVINPDYVAYDFTMNDNGEYSYAYSDSSNSIYSNNSGVITHIGDRLMGYYGEDTGGIIDITSPDGAHSFFSSSEYDYVVIDGNRIGKVSAINAYWNQEKNAFVWTTIEKNRLVIYEFNIES